MNIYQKTIIIMWDIVDIFYSLGPNQLDIKLLQTIRHTVVN